MRVDLRLLKLTIYLKFTHITFENPTFNKNIIIPRSSRLIRATASFPRRESVADDEVRTTEVVATAAQIIPI